MMKGIKLLTSGLLAMFFSLAAAQTKEVTGEYVVNAGFDNSAFNGNAPVGWTLSLSTSGVQSKISTAEKGGGVIAGGQNHWQLWQASGAMTGKACQQNSGLPAGRYKLTADVCSSFSGTIELYLNEAKTTVTSGDNKKYEVSALIADGNIEFGLDFKVTNGATVDFDSFRLYQDVLSNDDVSEVAQIWHGQCVADTANTKRQGWYNRDELFTAIKLYENANGNLDALREAVSMMEKAHANYQEICSMYSAMRAESSELYEMTKQSKFALKDSVKKVRLNAIKLYISKDDNYDQVKGYVSAVREMRGIYGAYCTLGKAISIARNQYKATDYDGKESLRMAMSLAGKLLESSTSSDEFLKAADDVKAAQDAYLKNRPSEWVTIQNGLLWKTTSGATVQAHAPGFVRVGDIWYMCGEDRANWWNPDVNLYSSTDLVHWKFEKKIIQNKVTTPELGSSRMIERPKLLYNAKTDKYIVWCHYESGNYGASEAACFECDSVNGAYKYVWSGRPLNVKSRDCNVFQDNDGTAYFVSTTEENRHLGLFRLSDDYHEAVAHTQLFSNQGREAPAIVRVGARYFMFNSACSGWDPNQCKMSYTNNLTSGWTNLANVGNPISYDTQAAAILEIKGTKTTTYLYVGDRWQDPGLPETKTIIFPISFNGTSCTFKYHERFDINFVTGEWRETPVEDVFADRSGWKIIDKSSEENGSGVAKYAIDGNPNTMWHTQYSGSVAPAPHHITIDMGKTECIKGFLVTPRMDSSTNGLIRKYEFLVSDDGKNWTSVSSGDWMPYCTEVDFAKKECRYIKLISKEGTYASVAELNVVLDHSVPVGVEQLPTATNSNAVSRQYITMEGLVTDSPAPGLCVVRTIFADGTSESRKCLVK